MLLSIVFVILGLTGCGKQMPHLVLDPQDLYSLPTLPAKYTELNQQLKSILDAGAEYAAPTSGTNIQPVQLVDLDGDGGEEAIAFFRESDAEKPLKIYIFTALDDTYVQTDCIEGSGTAIYSIAYSDLDGNGQTELLVGWKASTELQVLEAYTLGSRGAELLVRSNYVKYTTADLDQDGRQELMVLRADDQGEGIADYYKWQEDGSLSSQSSARISATMAELSQQGKITKGMLRGEFPALFVTSVTENPHAVTDILAVRNGELSNIVLSEVTGVSKEITTFCTRYPTDVNGDGLTEVPRLVLLELPGEESGYYQQIEWCQYDIRGKSTVVCRTYHAVEDGWYFKLPQAWGDRIWVERTTTMDETVVTFYIRESEKPFLRIFSITGSNREIRAVRGNRFVLSRQPETIYAAEFLAANESWRYGATMDEVRAAFNPILKEWSAGDN